MSPGSNAKDERLDGAVEAGLIRAAQSGCALSARRLVESHQDRLHAFVWRMMRNSHDAEEVCQDAFLRAFGALGGFDFRFRFSTWLFTIAYRLCLNNLRRRKEYSGDVEGVVGGSNDSDACQATADVVANTHEARRLKEAIWDSVDRLSTPQRAAVMLFYREQMSCQQIGEVLDMPAATVKSHLHRARANLRDALAGEMTSDWGHLRFAAEAS